jgi:hypothetical protein
MAQFDHRELGGAGQWMPGGMTMVGDMFNHGLKAKVDGLCSELSQILAVHPFVPFPLPVVRNAEIKASPAITPASWRSFSGCSRIYFTTTSCIWATVTSCEARATAAGTTNCFRGMAVG